MSGWMRGAEPANGPVAQAEFKSDRLSHGRENLPIVKVEQIDEEQQNQRVACARRDPCGFWHGENVRAGTGHRNRRAPDALRPCPVMVTLR